MTFGLRTVAIMAIASAAMVATGAVIGVYSRQSLIETLTAQQIAAQRDAQRLDEESQGLAKQIEQLQVELGNSRRQLDSTYAAVEVGGAVDFPVLRGMARPGDTLKSFAAREGVSVEVIRALNPWIKSDQMTLTDRQTIWIPKSAPATAAKTGK